MGASTPSASHDAATAAVPKTGDLSKEALVFEKLLTRVNEQNDGTGSRETTARVRIQADAGVKSMAVLSFTYTASNQQVDVGYVRVIKPDGSVMVTPDYNIQDLPADVTRAAPMYSDIHEKHVAVKGLGVGDTLEYQWTLHTLKPDVPGHFWFEYTFEKDLIVLDEQVDLDVPASKPVSLNCADLQPAVTTAGDRKRYHWSSNNLSRPDPDAPPKSTKKWKPSIQLTTFSSWEQVGAWYASLQKDRTTITPAIQARANSLTKGLSSTEDKVRAIFNDVAMHIHYVGLDFGIGRYQPHAADDVLSNEYGDCKDKHTLLAALLHAAGVEAWPVLIPSGRYLDPDTPSPAQFDHVITVVPLPDKLLWMDSTAEVAPAGVLTSQLRGKQGLVIPIGKPAYLERTPQDLPYLQGNTFKVEGTLDEHGAFTAKFDQEYHGDAELIFRSAFRSVPQSQWSQFIENILNNIGFAGEVKNAVVSPVEQTLVPMHFSFDYTREKYGDWDQHRISPALPPVGNELAPGVKQIKPADDVDLGAPGLTVYTSTIHLPDKWVLFPPHSVDLVEDWAEYHAKYSFANGVFIAERRIVAKKDSVPLSDWDKYLAFRRAIYQDEVQTEPLLSPEMARSFPSREFGVNALPERQGIVDAIKPLQDVASTLAGESSAASSDIAKARSNAQVALESIEEKSKVLDPDDARSLYWAQALDDAWLVNGWCALEAKDVAVAGTYLHAAWHLHPDQLSGLLLGRLMELQNDKGAAHQYELARAASNPGALGISLLEDYDAQKKLEEDYRRLTGREPPNLALTGREYNGSVQQQLDLISEIHNFIHSTKLTGEGLYILAFEAGRPVKAKFISGGAGFEGLVPQLQAHTYPTQLPNGSKARLLREMRLICSPYAGCDAYLLLSNAIQMPSHGVTFGIPPPDVPKGSKTVRVIHIPTE